MEIDPKEMVRMADRAEYANLKSLGLCPRCRKPKPEDGRVYCPSCREKARRIANDRRSSMTPEEKAEFRNKTNQYKREYNARNRKEIERVVKCQRCRHYADGICALHSVPKSTYYLGVNFKMKPDDFCSYGEQEDG